VLALDGNAPTLVERANVQLANRARRSGLSKGQIALQSNKKFRRVFAFLFGLIRHRVGHLNLGERHER
jgi:hypothetical protein